MTPSASRLLTALPLVIALALAVPRVAFAHPDATRELPIGERVRRFRRDVVSAHPELYGPAVRLGADPAQLDQHIGAWFAFLARDDRDLRAMADRLERELPSIARDFGERFGDWQCNAPIYFYFSAGAFDGAVRSVDGRTALLFGLEVASRTQAPHELRAFIVHELFHLHHRAVTGPALDAQLYGRLWREGLATHVSGTFAPELPDSVLLGWPRDLMRRVTPLLPSLTASLLADLETGDETAMQRPLLGDPGDGLPPRYGYVVALLVARDLAATRTLDELTRLQGDDLLALMIESLGRLRGGAGAPGSHGPGTAPPPA
jgi:hypothetical protein